MNGALPSVVAAYPAEYESEAWLADGGAVAIRPIRPDDASSLNEFHDHLSSDTVYFRFFHAHPHLLADELTRFTQVDYVDRLALVAELDGRLVGVGRYDRGAGGGDAEVAFVVTDVLQGHGLGTLLLEHLAAAGRRRGVSTFVADTLGMNHPMLHVFKQAGFATGTAWADGVVHVTFGIEPSDGYLSAVMGRLAQGLRGRWGPPPRADVVAVGPAVEWSEGRAGQRVHAIDADPADVVAWVGSGSGAGEVWVDGSQVDRPRRLIAAARTAEADVRIVVLGGLAEMADQASAVRISSLTDLAARRWPVKSPGTLATPAGCDARAARRLLDEQPAEGLGEQLLATYGIDTDFGGARITAGDSGGHLSIDVDGRRRLLPLTDRDALYLSDGSEALAEDVARLGRLIDDQPDLRQVEIDGRVRISTGTRRDTVDDPFVRRAGGTSLSDHRRNEDD